MALERNPYYWKVDEAGTPLPYLAEVDFVLAGNEDMQVMRFQSGESDVISRVSAMNFSILEKDGRGAVIPPRRRPRAGIERPVF